MHHQVVAADLVELNRVVAKVNNRVVTWGEIEKAIQILKNKN